MDMRNKLRKLVVFFWNQDSKLAWIHHFCCLARHWAQANLTENPIKIIKLWKRIGFGHNRLSVYESQTRVKSKSPGSVCAISKYNYSKEFVCFCGEDDFIRFRDGGSRIKNNF